MGFGLYKKLKNAVKKATEWAKNKIIKPTIKTAKKVLTSDTTKQLMNSAVKLAPAITTAVATSKGMSPQSGYAIGSSIKSIGESLGYG